MRVGVFLLIFSLIISLPLYAIEFTLNMIKEGDLIFQETTTEQSKAIKLATNSRYTHCGVIICENNEFTVLEAIQPVSITPIKVFISRSVGGHFVIKRLKNELLISQLNISLLKEKAKKFIGKDYDYLFEWSDNKIYCSELVWKLYKEVFNIEVGKTKTLESFNLNNSEVKAIMKKRYNGNIPYNEIVISPESVFRSKYLITIYNSN